MEIRKPINESRTLKGSTLESGIKCINVQDDNLDRSHVMVSVNIGSISNPFEYQGLAHFLEHMLFLGSTKYPGENDFANFLNENGGDSNAYTDTFETVYYFSVFNDKLDKAIDMFSRFFIDPLFDKDSVNREINAIQSEHNKNVQQDNWRLHHLFGLISKEGSMINKFGTGNLESLQKDGVRDAMISFYNKYYVSSNINIVTVSSLDNNVVNKYVKKSFSNIPKKIVPKITLEKPFFENKGKNYFLKSVSKEHRLVYLWEVPDNVKNYLTSHSPHIISHVISSDNNDSLKQVLIKKGLISTLYSYVPKEGMFVINVKLSKVSNWKKVDSYVRYYVTDLINNDWKKIAEYYQKKDKIIFNFSSKQSSNSLGLKLVTDLNYYPIEDCYIGPDVIENVSESEIQSLLKDYLTFDKVNIILSSDIDHTSLDSNVIGGKVEREPYYELSYVPVKLNASIAQPFKYEIISENPFLDVSPKWIDGLDETLVPIQVGGYPFKCWFGNVSMFKETIIYSELIFTNSEITFGIGNCLNTIILLKYINRKLEKNFNLASEIGFSANLNLSIMDSIVTITIAGHNDKFQEYFNMVILYLKEFKFDEEDSTMIEMIIESTKDSFNNINKTNPWGYSNYLEQLSMIKNLFTIEDALGYLNSLDAKSFFKKINETLNRVLFESKFTILTYGNVEFSELFEKGNKLIIDFPSFEKPRNVINMLKDIDSIHPNPDEKDNYVQFSHYIGTFQPKSALLLLVLTISLSQKFYDELRTKQQFGYLVSSHKNMYQNEFNYFKQQIQSSKSIDEIEQAILKFNNEFLSTVTEEDFKKYVESAKNLLEERDNSTIELVGRYLDEIYYNKFTFERRILLLQHINKITFGDYKKFYTDKILKGDTKKMYIRSQNNKV